MTNFRSLVGGFYSATPLDKASGPTSIRSNNPGAINGAAWERNMPGYVDEVETTPGNKTTIFEAPEYGVACWWHLLSNYRKGGAITVGQIINRYGGGQDYSNYIAMVVKWSGLTENTEIKLDDTPTLLKFGKAMFQYEAGKTIPWSDEQITYGIKLGQGVQPPEPVVAEVETVTITISLSIPKGAKVVVASQGAVK